MGYPLHLDRNLQFPHIPIRSEWPTSGTKPTDDIIAGISRATRAAAETFAACSEILNTVEHVMNAIHNVEKAYIWSAWIASAETVNLSLVEGTSEDIPIIEEYAEKWIRDAIMRDFSLLPRCVE
jgi:hypothetical protein